MFESWNMDGADMKPAPWKQEDFFGEVRKLSGIKEPTPETVKPRGLLVSRNESVKAEHALGSYGVEYTVEDVDSSTLRIVTQSLDQAAGLLRHAKVTFKEDMVEAKVKVAEPTKDERDQGEILVMLSAAQSLAKALNMSQAAQDAVLNAIDKVTSELGNKA
jgi:hypothetical protein